MAMSVGSITVNPVTGSHSGSGAALAVFDNLIASTDMTLLTGVQLAAAKQGMANLVIAVAQMIDYIQTHAVTTVTVTAGTAGLQRSAFDSLPTLAPVLPQNITGTIA